MRLIPIYTMFILLPVGILANSDINECEGISKYDTFYEASNKTPKYIFDWSIPSSISLKETEKTIYIHPLTTDVFLELEINPNGCIQSIEVNANAQPADIFLVWLHILKHSYGEGYVDFLMKDFGLSDVLETKEYFIDKILSRGEIDYKIKLDGSKSIIRVNYKKNKSSLHKSPMEDFPVFESSGTWLDSNYEIKNNNNLILRQFEIYGVESAYKKNYYTSFTNQNTDVKYPTYSLDFNWSSNLLKMGLQPKPIFSVLLENTSKKEILLTKIIYRVKEIGRVAGGEFKLVSPIAKFKHQLEYKVGDQEFQVVPALKIAPDNYSNFLIELDTNHPNVGLVWLMDVYFIESDEKGGVSSKTIQLIMTGDHE